MDTLAVSPGWGAILGTAGARHTFPAQSNRGFPERQAKRPLATQLYSKGPSVLGAVLQRRRRSASM